MQDHATIPPALASCEPFPHDPELARLWRELAAIGAPSADDNYETDAPAAKARFVQHLQVYEAPGAEECLVA